MSVAVATIDSIGLFSDVAKLAVSTTAVSHTISSAKKGLLLMNIGTSQCFMGGSTVSASMGSERGIIMLPRVYFIFRNAKTTLQVYFICKTGESTDIGIVEYA